MKKIRIAVAIAALFGSAVVVAACPEGQSLAFAIVQNANAAEMLESKHNAAMANPQYVRLYQERLAAETKRHAGGDPAIARYSAIAQSQAQFGSMSDVVKALECAP